MVASIFCLLECMVSMVSKNKFVEHCCTVHKPLGPVQVRPQPPNMELVLYAIERASSGVGPGHLELNVVESFRDSVQATW